MKTTSSGANFFRTVSLILLCISSSVRGQSGPPPYANVSADHSTTGSATTSILADSGYCSRYDPAGLADGSSGKLYHSSMAYTHGVWGGAWEEVFDRMVIPFTVNGSDYYDINVSGVVNVGRFSVGEDIGMFGSHWGDFEIVMQPMFIKDTTGDQLVYAASSTTIYYEDTSLIESISPIVKELLEREIEVLARDLGISDFVNAAIKIDEILDRIHDIVDAAKLISTNFNQTVTVYLTAGHQYTLRPLLASKSSASSLVIGYGGHISAVQGFLQVTNFSVLSTTPKYSLTVQSSGASGVNVVVTPIDLSGHSSGNTPLSLSYAPETSVTLTAPATVGNKTFSTWSGVDSQSGNVAHLTINGSRSATAIYSSPQGTVTITAPNGGGVYQRGRNLYINWTCKDVTGQNVSLELLKGGALNTVMTSSTYNSGFYTWAIPSAQTVGTDYRVRVNVLGSGVSDESDSNFEITTNTPTLTRIDIWTLSDLARMSTNWNDGQHPRNGYYVLMADIDANDTRNWNGGLGFKPIGNGYNDWFRGTFDGQGHRISNLYCKRPNEAYAALFAVTMDNAVIKNLAVEVKSSFHARGYANYGGLGYGGVGGIVGENSGLIQNCHVSVYPGGNMYVTNGSHCGGIVGENFRGTILNCSVTGASEIEARGASAGDGLGGIAGVNSGLIRWCWVGTGVQIDGDVSSANSDEVGGIVGSNEGGRVLECESRASWIDGRYYIGGVVGYNYGGGDIRDCYYSGTTVTCDGIAAGLTGENYGSITRCYVSGGISGSGTRGALVGENYAITQESYWNTEATSFPVVGSNLGTVSNCFSRIGTQMMQQATFTNWDFAGVWAIDEGLDLPILRGIGTNLTAPTNLMASTSLDYGVEVAWSAVSNATHYMVFRSDTADGSRVALASNWVTGLTFLDTTPQPLTTFYYWVKAGTTMDGGRASEFSSQAAGSRTQPPLDAPQSVSASDGLLNQVLVEWPPVADAGYYQVYRSATLGGSKVALTGWQTNAFLLDSSGMANTVYYYWVKAASSSGGNRASDYSVPDQGSFTTPSPPSLAVARQSENVILSWPANAVGFTLVSVTNLSSTNWTLVSPLPVIVNGMYTVTNSATGATKFYRLKNP